jgi:hypothetical protein
MLSPANSKKETSYLQMIAMKGAARNSVTSITRGVHFNVFDRF